MLLTHKGCVQSQTKIPLAKSIVRRDFFETVLQVKVLLAHFEIIYLHLSVIASGAIRFFGTV
jgi:hypothetical protein